VVGVGVDDGGQGAESGAEGAAGYCEDYGVGEELDADVSGR
jgi:hypothetical protein